MARHRTATRPPLMLQKFEHNLEEIEQDSFVHKHNETTKEGFLVEFELLVKF